MLLLVLTLTVAALTSGSPSLHFYDTFGEARFPMPATSCNAFDYNALSLQVTVAFERTVQLRSTGFFVGNGTFAARFPLQRSGGRYRVVEAYFNGSCLAAPISAGGSAEASAPARSGPSSVRAKGTQFVDDAGDTLFTLGVNMAWGALNAYGGWLNNTHANGVNLIRVWLGPLVRPAHRCMWRCTQR